MLRMLALLSVLAACTWGAPPAFAAGGSSGVVATVNDVVAQTAKFRSLMANLTQTQFHLVNAQSLLAPGDGNALRNALRKHAADIDSLRESLTHTTMTGNDGSITTLKKVLAAQNVTIDQVIGVSVDSSGAITLYYQ
jgi:hypothetical protein